MFTKICYYRRANLNLIPMPRREEKIAYKYVIIIALVAVAIGYLISTLFAANLNLGGTTALTSTTSSNIATNNASANFSQNLTGQDTTALQQSLGLNVNMTNSSTTPYLQKMIIEYDKSGNVVKQQIQWSNGQTTDYGI